MPYPEMVGVVVIAAVVVVEVIAEFCPNTVVGKEYQIHSLPQAPICASKCHGVSKARMVGCWRWVRGWRQGNLHEAASAGRPTGGSIASASAADS